MHRLIIEDDEGKTTVVPLVRDEITIGRKEGNTIRLTERNVSRSHARITRQNGSVYVEDLGSHNGVRVNGNRIDGRVTVQEGDRIQIGDYLLAVRKETDTTLIDTEDAKKTMPGLRALDTIVDTAPIIAPVGDGDTTTPTEAAPADPMDAAPTIP